MRIISDFHDYYDKIQQFGQNREIIWQRKSKIIKYKSKYNITDSSLDVWLFPYFNYHRLAKYDLYLKIIWFCNKIYPIIKLTYYNTNTYKHNLHTFVTIEELDKFLKENLSKKEFNIYFDKTYIYMCDRNKLIEFLNSDIKHYSKILEEHAICVVDFSKLEIEINPSLKKNNFMSVIDPYTAFQELEMWFNNKTVPMKPIPKLDDETMRDIKGFDSKSFKKEKKHGSRT